MAGLTGVAACSGFNSRALAVVVRSELDAARRFGKLFLVRSALNSGHGIRPDWQASKRTSAIMARKRKRICKIYVTDM